MIHARLRAAAGNRDGIPTDGLIAHYTMDNISGSTLVDETGTYDGTITGATQVAGVIGQALDFDGTNDHVELLGSSAWSLETADYTMSLWINLDTITQTMVLASSRGTGGTDGMLLRAETSTRKLLYGNIGVSPNLVTSEVLSIGTWDHVIVTRSGTLTSIRFNDSPVGSATQSDGTNVGTNVFLGKQGINPATDRLNGQLDQLRVYNRVLTAAEITSLYNEGA